MAVSSYTVRSASEAQRVSVLGVPSDNELESQVSITEFDLETGQWRLTVDQLGATATLEFGSDGALLINGAPIAGLESGLSPGQIIDVGTVAGSIEDVSAVAAIAADVTTVAGFTSPELQEVVDAAATIDDSVAAAVASATAAAASQVEAAASEDIASTQALDASGSASQAVAAVTECRQWAAAEPGVEIEPGLESCRATAIRVRSLARSIAGVPTRTITGTTGALIKATDSVKGDEFSAVICANGSACVFTLPLDWNTTLAEDGSPGLAWCRIMAIGAGSVTLAGAAGTAPAAVEQSAEWQGTRSWSPDNSGGAAIDVVIPITVPAGVGRKLWVAAFDINDFVATHNLTAAIDVGTMTASVANTSPASADHSTEKVNAASWTVALADSATAATDHVVTITVPPSSLALSYRIVAANNVNAISGAVGDSTATIALTKAVSVTAPVNGLVLGALTSVGNDSLPASLSGATAAATAISSGATAGKDIAMIAGRILPSVSGANGMTATFAQSRKGAFLGVCFEKATSGGVGATVYSTTLVVPPGGWLDVLALSDGRTYYVHS